MIYKITWGISRIKYLWIFSALFILFYVNSYSEIKVTINDTTITRGITSQIFIYGTVTDENISSIRIVFEYNTLDLFVHSANGSEAYSMKCDKPVLTTNLDDLTKSKVSVSCNDILKVQDGIICVLNIEGLVGPDTVSSIKLDSIFINGDYYNITVKDSGIINVPGMPVIQNYPEGIGYNYPNPLYEETIFDISIHEPTKVQFIVYALDGSFVFSNEKPIEMLELSFYKNSEEIPIGNLNQKLDKGSYKLKFKPDNMQFSSGEYYLIMITDNGVYHRNFIYLK